MMRSEQSSVVVAELDLLNISEEQVPEPIDAGRVLDLIGAAGHLALWPDAAVARAFPDAHPLAVLALLARLKDEGRIERWADAPRGSSVILSPAEAAARGLVLDDKGRGWRDPRARRWGDVVRHEEVVLAEERDASGDCPEGKRMPYGATREGWPTVLVGQWVPWEGPGWLARRPCPGCGSRAMPTERYCLACDERGCVRGARRRGPS
jgi:hypothetical protein